METCGVGTPWCLRPLFHLLQLCSIIPCAVPLSWVGGVRCPMPTWHLPAEPTWTEWGAWGPCSRSCGSAGTRVRRRSCKNAKKLLCAGRPAEVQKCPPSPCPGTCPWGHGDAADPTGGGDPGVSAPCRPAACPEHTLQGTVVSAAGAALPGARIYLEGRPPVLVARSDTRGNFHVAGVCEGTAANISAHRDGFVPGLAPVISNGSGVSVARVTLQKLGEHRGTGGCAVTPSGS